MNKGKALFQPLPRESTRRGNGQQWTMAHGFFIQMGGFVLYENEYPKEVLDYKRLAGLLWDKAIDAPITTESDLWDRSKGDSVSKTIVVLQTTWFLVQCIARGVQRMPLSELEVLTLAFAVLNVAIYAAWWNKPQGVNMTICVPLKRLENGSDDHTVPLTDTGAFQTSSRSAPANLAQLEHCHVNGNLPSVPPHEQPNHVPGLKRSWLRRKLRKDRDLFYSPFFVVFLPLRLLQAVLRILNKMGEADEFERKQLRVPMFYSDNLDWTDIEHVLLTVSVVGASFGAIHLLGWSLTFSSPHDLVLWRTSAIVLTVTPILLFLISITSLVEMKNIDILCSLLGIFYIASRLVVIILSIIAIHRPPHNVLLDVSWTRYIPHF